MLVITSTYYPNELSNYFVQSLSTEFTNPIIEQKPFIYVPNTTAMLNRFVNLITSCIHRVSDVYKRFPSILINVTWSKQGNVNVCVETSLLKTKQTWQYALYRGIRYRYISICLPVCMSGRTFAGNYLWDGTRYWLRYLWSIAIGENKCNAQES